MAIEKIHMNAQGGSTLQQPAAVKGKTEIRSEPRTAFKTAWKLVSRIHIDLVTDVLGWTRYP
jgi:hypothetical protein